MQSLLTPQTFEFFAKYLLAGFVFMAARSWFVAGERPRINDTLVESVILSLINQIVALFTLKRFVIPTTGATPDVSLVLEVVVQPAILGVIVGALASRNWFPAGLRRLFMPTVKPVNPTLDFAFDDLAGPAFLIVRFENGHEALGYFGERSIVGSDRQTGDIFLEDIYVVGDNGDWVHATPRRSAWINLSGIRSIEFITDGGS